MVKLKLQNLFMHGHVNTEPVSVIAYFWSGEGDLYQSMKNVEINVLKFKK